MSASDGPSPAAAGARRPRRVRQANPVLVKELRGRMRGARAFVVLTVYLLLMSCLAALIHFSMFQSAGRPYTSTDLAMAGRALFGSVVGVVLAMACFVAPAFTAAAIAGERERKTLELLRSTLLSARRLVWGKLSSALTYVYLLVLAALPLQSMAFMLGGLTIEELLIGLLLTLVTAFAFAVLGLFYSALVRSTLAATVLSYATALFLVLGLPVLLLLFASIGFAGIDVALSGNPTPSWQLQATLLCLGVLLAATNPITTVIISEALFLEEGALLLYWIDLDATHRVPIVSPWLPYTLLYLLLPLLLLVLTVLLVRRPERK